MLFLTQCDRFIGFTFTFQHTFFFLWFFCSLWRVCLWVCRWLSLSLATRGCGGQTGEILCRHTQWKLLIVLFFLIFCDLALTPSLPEEITGKWFFDVINYVIMIRGTFLDLFGILVYMTNVCKKFNPSTKIKVKVAVKGLKQNYKYKVSLFSEKWINHHRFLHLISIIMPCVLNHSTIHLIMVM